MEKRCLHCNNVFFPALEAYATRQKFCKNVNCARERNIQAQPAYRKKYVKERMKYSRLYRKKFPRAKAAWDAAEKYSPLGKYCVVCKIKNVRLVRDHPKGNYKNKLEVRTLCISCNKRLGNKKGREKHEMQSVRA